MFTVQSLFSWLRHLCISKCVSAYLLFVINKLDFSMVIKHNKLNERRICAAERSMPHTLCVHFVSVIYATFKIESSNSSTIFIISRHFYYRKNAKHSELHNVRLENLILGKRKRRKNNTVIYVIPFGLVGVLLRKSFSHSRSVVEEEREEKGFLSI